MDTALEIASRLGLVDVFALRRVSDERLVVGDVSAEKRLADELEVTQVALSVASLPTKTATASVSVAS